MTQPHEQPQETGDAPDKPVEPPPVYRKPTLRRYDQIDQVRPYGPSERKAG